jgi:hypothetical protein
MIKTAAPIPYLMGPPSIFRSLRSPNYSIKSVKTQGKNTKARRPVSGGDGTTGLDPDGEQFYLMLGRNLGSRLYNETLAGS